VNIQIIMLLGNAQKWGVCCMSYTSSYYPTSWTDVASNTNSFADLNPSISLGY
jgi:hypothetical protein